MSPHIWSRVSSRASLAQQNMATYCHGRIHSNNIALLDQQLARLVAQLADLVLRYGAAGAQLLDGLVEVTAAYAHCGDVCMCVCLRSSCCWSVCAIRSLL